MNQETKPREFWIKFVTNADDEVMETLVYGIEPQVLFDYHVIEHSAYQSALGRIKKLKNKIEQAVTTINEMQNACKPFQYCNKAFNIGASFNSQNPEEFNKHLDLRHQLFESKAREQELIEALKLSEQIVKDAKEALRREGMAVLKVDKGASELKKFLEKFKKVGPR